MDKKTLKMDMFETIQDSSGIVVRKSSCNAYPIENIDLNKMYEEQKLQAEKINALSKEKGVK